MRDYYDKMVEMAVMYGADRDRAVHEMREVIKFVMAVSNVCAQFEVH